MLCSLWLDYLCYRGSLWALNCAKMQQTTNVASNTQCIAVTSRQPYMRLTFRSLQRSVTLPASQTLQHNLCQTWKSPVRSRLLSGLWCVLLFLEHRNFPGMNRQDARRAAQHVDDWLTDRHWNTEAESHFSREWNWGKERCGNTLYRATATPVGQRWTHVC